MRVVGAILQVFFLCLVLVEAGCEPVPVATELPTKDDNGFNTSIYTRYAPVKIDIMPLTEFTCVSDGEEASKINVYVSLLDAFDCQRKTPGVFRFELYEYIQRCAEPKGKRIAIWPDIDLTKQSENNKHWRDFLRAYEFNLDCRQTSLDFEPKSNQSYILQVTCLCPNGKRLSSDFGLKHTK